MFTLRIAKFGQVRCQQQNLCALRLLLGNVSVLETSKRDSHTPSLGIFELRRLTQSEPHIPLLASCEMFQ